MPNHIHAILRCRDEYGPADVVREFKKATANLVIRQFEAEGHDSALEFMAGAVKPGQDQEYALWENEYQAKNVYSPTFLRQKLEYVHNNPLQPHWRLAQKPEEYVWSSARYYLVDERPLIPLSDARDLLV
jgi:REP element-mobilizing transposase RayT